MTDWTETALSKVDVGTLIESSMDAKLKIKKTHHNRHTDLQIFTEENKSRTFSSQSAETAF